MSHTRQIASLSCAFALALLAGSCGSGSNSVSSSTTPSFQANVSLSPGALEFGNVLVGTSSPQQAMTLQNTGTAPLMINDISVTGDYTVSNDCAASLAPTSFCTLSVTFGPQGPGARSGKLQTRDNAPSSPQMATLSGTGITAHGVSLNWDASTSVVSGYFVFRSGQSGGPYHQLNRMLITSTNFQDKAPGGQNWYYVVTAVDANLIESLPSNEAAAILPP
jgi:hypothetical protein